VDGVEGKSGELDELESEIRDERTQFAFDSFGDVEQGCESVRKTPHFRILREDNWQDDREPSGRRLDFNSKY